MARYPGPKYQIQFLGEENCLRDGFNPSRENATCATPDVDQGEAIRPAATFCQIHKPLDFRWLRETRICLLRALRQVQQTRLLVLLIQLLGEQPLPYAPLNLGRPYRLSVSLHRDCAGNESNTCACIQIDLTGTLLDRVDCEILLLRVDTGK